MTTILKGLIFVSVFLCILSTVYAQKEDPKIQTDKIQNPFVLNANEVPVLGGLLNIYGLNFGKDPNVISVYIYDTPTSSSNNDGHKIECADVKIVLPNSIISCVIYEVGTGRSKHIQVTVNGVSNTNTDDVNFAFSRSAPMLNSITYDEFSVIRVYGHHFGINPSIVSVFIDGYDHPVIGVNDSVITCNKHEQFQLPSDGNVTTASVMVVVDNQQSEASMNLVMEDNTHIGGSNDFDDVKEDSMFSSILNLDSTKMITIALIPGVAGVVILIGFLIIRRRRSSSNSTAPITIGSDNEKAESHAVITGGNLVRDSSMEEIDLTSDTDRAPIRPNVVVEMAKESPLKKSSSGMQSPTIYELNRVTSSSSESSFSSPYSSANNTPSLRTPDSRRGGRSALDMSDFSSATHNSRRSRREQASSAMGEPISRLGKRSMDSPYFTKENPFDSPMRSPFDTPTRSPLDSPLRSPDLIPSVDSGEEYSYAGSGHPLQSSQEINQHHRNPFDSPSVLHSAIQRAAMLRSQQQQQQPRRKSKHSSPAGALRKKGRPIAARRASLGGPQEHNPARRSSLGTISLHASALHASMGDYAHSTDDDNCESDQDHVGSRKPTSLRSAQYIDRIEEASDE